MINRTTVARIDALCERYRVLAAKYVAALAEIALAELPETVYHSNAIENSTLTLEDTERILTGFTPGGVHNVREIFEVTNLAAVTKDIMEHPVALDTEQILRWHGMLLSTIRPDLAGRFRKSGEWVRVRGHLGANPEFVPDLISEMLTKYQTNREMHFLEKIAWFHCEFEIIHPFGDGNGRIGRVLMNQQLITLGLPPVIVRAKNRQRDYYPLLERYAKTDDFGGMSKLLALLLQESLHKRITLLESKRVIPLSAWAKSAGVSPNVVTNKAKRQTIPAFRIRERWMIASDWQPDQTSSKG